MAVVTDAHVRRFPWESIDKTTRAEVNALHDLKRWAAGHLFLDGLAPALAELLDVQIKLYIAGARPLNGSRPMDHGVGALLARADVPDIARSALIEVETALAATVVARALRRSVPSLVDTSAANAAGMAGAFAAVVVAAARRAHVGIAMRVLRVAPARALEADLSQVDPDLWAVSLTVLVANDAFAARVVAPRNAIPFAPPAWGIRELAALGATPLSLPIVVYAATATATDVATLRIGDALVLDGRRWPLSGGGTTATVGPVWLASPSSDRGLCALLGENGRLVVGGRLESMTAEAQMDPDDKAAVVTALGEVPVVVRVEIGEALMTARDWASLGRGDVVALGRRLGEPVLLRVGGVPLARGELVELDGEVAVRIVDRFVGETTTP